MTPHAGSARPARPVRSPVATGPPLVAAWLSASTAALAVALVLMLRLAAVPPQEINRPDARRGPQPRTAVWPPPMPESGTLRDGAAPADVPAARDPWGTGA